MENSISVADALQFRKPEEEYDRSNLNTVMDNMADFCSENIENYDPSKLYAFTEMKFNNCICVDMIIDDAVIKVYTTEEDRENILNQYATYFNRELIRLSTNKPILIDAEIENLPQVMYHMQDYRYNLYANFLWYIDRILELPMICVMDGAVEKSIYPNILAFSKEKLSVKLPICMRIQDDVIWEFEYIIDAKGNLNLNTLETLKSAYPDKITQEFIDNFIICYNQLCQLASPVFSLSFFSFLRKLYKRSDTIVKALVNVARFSENHKGYRSEYYSVFQEARMRDVESDEANLCDQIKYKGVFKTETFKEFLGTEEMDGTTYCPALEALNQYALNEEDRTRVLNESSANPELKPVYLYVYHLGNTENAARKLMEDYDKYEKIRQQLSKHIWFYNFNILKHELKFEGYVDYTLGDKEPVLIQNRPKTISWWIHDIPEQIKIIKYRKRSKSSGKKESETE